MGSPCPGPGFWGISRIELKTLKGYGKRSSSTQYESQDGKTVQTTQ